MKYYSFLDLLLLPLYLLVIIAGARMYARSKVKKDPIYKYFTAGLVAKLMGGLSLAIVYTFYYPGGDTIHYFSDSVVVQKLAFYNIKSFTKVMFGPASGANFYYFNDDTGYAAYCMDPKTWTVVKLTFFVTLFSFRCFSVATVLCAMLSFAGVWRLYKVFASEFPELKKEMAISFLFVPSVFFWGSGILKDTFTFGALGFLFGGLYSVFVKKDNYFSSVFAVIISSYIIISIKPYILVGLLPAIILWYVQLNVGKINAETVRFLSIPLLVLAGLGTGYLILSFMGESLAEYKIDNILEKARITQRDLKSDYYQGNSFDIGDFDSTIPSILSKFPIATFSAIFRPLVVESNNFVMFLSGLENLVLLIYFLRITILVRGYGFIRYLFRHHMLTFSFFFALLFAFSVGLSTSNFGSLVRYKIPCIPFFVASLFLIRHLRMKDLEIARSKRIV